MTRWAAAAVVAVTVLSTRLSAGPVDPALVFRTIVTPHFVVHFHQHEEPLAQRLAEVAERIHAELVPRLGARPSRVTHVILVDQDDAPNGSATVVPWPAIQIVAAPPAGTDDIGNTGDWLVYVFTHEYAHILHLDRSRGWARAARALFGRREIAFPNLTLPLWHIEGLATLVESRNGQGRLYAGDFLQIVGEAARRHRMEPLDRVNGGLVDWPSGEGWYAYGASFQQYLENTYGTDRTALLANRTAGRLPYLTAGAFKQVYGRSLGALWRDFQAATAADARQGRAAEQSPTLATQMTHQGFALSAPRADAHGAVYYTASDPHGFPGIYRAEPDGPRPTRVASAFRSRGVAVGTDILIFDQQEFVRGAGLQGDLYAHDLRTGRTRRLTRGARLVEPDLRPDGHRLAAIRVRGGAREVVVLDADALLNAGTPVDGRSLPIIARTAPMDAVAATPRWSPDGRWIAVERRRLQQESRIELLDAGMLSTISILAASAGGRTVSPAWRPGGRSLLYAAAEGRAAFEIMEVAVGPDGQPGESRRLTRAAAGARAPAPLPDGRVVYIGYGVAGDDLFVARSDTVTQPLPSSPSQSEQPLSNPVVPEEPRAQVARDRPYSPWSTLVPRGWFPLVEHRDERWRVGGVTYGIDVLQRHVIELAATWAITTGDLAPPSLAPRGRPDVTASYAYQRWQPVFYAVAQDETALFNSLDASGALVPMAERRQQLDLGVVRPFPRVRHAQSISAAYHLDRTTTSVAALDRRSNRSGLRTAWQFNSSRRYGYSISAEDGVLLAATGEFQVPALGADGRARALTADARAYVPLGVSHAVAAARLAGGTSSGDQSVRRIFTLGGSDGNDAPGGFGSDGLSLLRGFGHTGFAGTHVVVSNLEARVPLGYPQRGFRTWPIFLRAVHATGFVDIGHVWTDDVRWADRKIGAGAELSADVIAGYGLPLTWSMGIAWGQDGAGRVPDHREIYLRVGRSF